MESGDEMDYDDEDCADSDGYDSEGGASDAFEAPPVQAVEQTFRVLTPEECLARANAKVQEVVELLCCDAQVAALLLRHFRWDSDKLTDGARRCHRASHTRTRLQQLVHTRIPDRPSQPHLFLGPTFMRLGTHAASHRKPLLT